MQGRCAKSQILFSWCEKRESPHKGDKASPIIPERERRPKKTKSHILSNGSLSLNYPEGASGRDRVTICPRARLPTLAILNTFLGLSGGPVVLQGPRKYEGIGPKLILNARTKYDSARAGDRGNTVRVTSSIEVDGKSCLDSLLSMLGLSLLRMQATRLKEWR